LPLPARGRLQLMANLSPFGYGPIVALERQHRVLLPQLDARGGGLAPTFARTQNGIALSQGEFIAASRDHPIVFAPLSDGTAAPMAVVGLSVNENLMLDAEGYWRADSYVPAFLRRFPFCLSVLEIDGVRQEDKVVCVDESYLDAGGIALFTPDGTPSPRWNAIFTLLEDYERDQIATAKMCEVLTKFELLEAMTVRVLDGARVSSALTGMLRVSEEKLKQLKPAQLKALTEKGLMACIYAHLFSLNNFERLSALAKAKVAVAKKSRRGQ
jgi:hypothetical protein